MRQADQGFGECRPESPCHPPSHTSFVVRVDLVVDHRNLGQLTAHREDLLQHASNASKLSGTLSIIRRDVDDVEFSIDELILFIFVCARRLGQCDPNWFVSLSELTTIFLSPPPPPSLLFHFPSSYLQTVPKDPPHRTVSAPREVAGSADGQVPGMTAAALLPAPVVRHWHRGGH